MGEGEQACRAPLWSPPAPQGPGGRTPASGRLRVRVLPGTREVTWCLCIKFLCPCYGKMAVLRDGGQM